MVDFYLDMLGAARFDFQIYSDGAQEAVAAGRAIIISTAGCMIASSSAFWWCSGFSFHDETAVANVGSLYHRATTYSLELYLPVLLVRTVAANDDSIVSSPLALMRVSGNSSDVALP